MAGNNTGASRLKTAGLDKKLAYGEHNVPEQRNPPTAGNNTGVSRTDRELAYGEKNIRPSAITQALRA